MTPASSPRTPIDVPRPAATGHDPGSIVADEPTASPPPAARCRSLSLGYGHRTVLTDIDLDIAPGAVTALIGPNGAGKSTLLHALAGLSRPRRGVLDIPARARPGGVALVLQATDANARLPLTVGEVVAMGRYPYHRWWGRLTERDRRAIDTALDILDIRDLTKAQMQEISGGQRQRALVAQGLAQDADLLLLDEPYTGLDMLSRSDIQRAIDHEQERGRAVVLSTHDIADAAAAHQVVLLAARLVAAGAPDTVLTDKNLAAAYGSRLVHLGGVGALLDDPHEHH